MPPAGGQAAEDRSGGSVLAEVKGTRARYEPKGDELYVRAKIISSKLKANATATNEMEMAWTQPIVTGMK